MYWISTRMSARQRPLPTDLKTSSLTLAEWAHLAIRHLVFERYDVLNKDACEDVTYCHVAYDLKTSNLTIAEWAHHAIRHLLFERYDGLNKADCEDVTLGHLAYDVKTSYLTLAECGHLNTLHVLIGIFAVLNKYACECKTGSSGERFVNIVSHWSRKGRSCM